MEIIKASDKVRNDGYTNPKGTDFSSIPRATKKAMKESFAMPTAAGGDKVVEAEEPGFNKDLKKKIKNSDNIAQKTRRSVRLEKKEDRQEARAKRIIKRNPEYAQGISDKTEGRVDASIGKLDAAMNSYKPVNGTTGTMPTTSLMNDGGGAFGLSKSVANGSTTPSIRSTSIHSRNSWGINKPNTEKYL
tara:strand:+ start:160 stop:726 length:567 start_codon:yes stop_codon:yes gene_type:complete